MWSLDVPVEKRHDHETARSSAVRDQVENWWPTCASPELGPARMREFRDKCYWLVGASEGLGLALGKSFPHAGQT